MKKSFTIKCTTGGCNARLRTDDGYVCGGCMDQITQHLKDVGLDYSKIKTLDPIQDSEDEDTYDIQYEVLED